MLEFCTERRALFSCERLAFYEYLLLLPIMNPLLTYILHRQYFLCHYYNLIFTDNIFQNTLFIFQNKIVSSRPQPHQRWLTTMKSTRQVKARLAERQTRTSSWRLSEGATPKTEAEEGMKERRKEGRKERTKENGNERPGNDWAPACAPHTSHAKIVVHLIARVTLSHFP